MQPDHSKPLPLSDRMSAYYIEEAHVSVADGCVVYSGQDESEPAKNLPRSNIAVLFLGPATSISQEAARLLAAEHVHVAFTGPGGTPVHMASLAPTSDGTMLRRAVLIGGDPNASLKAAQSLASSEVETMRSIGVKLAKKIPGAYDTTDIKKVCREYYDAFDDATSIAKLREVRSNYDTALLTAVAKASGLSKRKAFQRTAGKVESDKAAERVNALISIGEDLANGVCDAALWSNGIPQNVELQDGTTIVTGISAALRNAFVLPIAFAVGKKKSSDTPLENVFRDRLIRAFDSHAALETATMIIDRMLERAEATDFENAA